MRTVSVVFLNDSLTITKSCNNSQMSNFLKYNHLSESGYIENLKILRYLPLPLSRQVKDEWLWNVISKLLSACKYIFELTVNFYHSRACKPPLKMKDIVHVVVANVQFSNEGKSLFKLLLPNIKGKGINMINSNYYLTPLIYM